MLPNRFRGIQTSEASLFLTSVGKLTLSKPRWTNRRIFDQINAKRDEGIGAHF